MSHNNNNNNNNLTATTTGGGARCHHATSSCHLASDEALDLLRQALEQAEQEFSSLTSATTLPKPSFAVHSDSAALKDSLLSSDDEGDQHDQEDSSSASSDENGNGEVSDGNDDGDNTNLSNATTEPLETAERTLLSQHHPELRPKPKKAKPQQTPNQLIKQLGRPPCLSFPLPTIESQSLLLLLDVPVSILSRQERRQFVEDKPAMCRSILHTAETVRHQPVLVLLLRSGRFAGGVFQGTKCLVHRACQRYTVRRGQGKAQSSQDNSKRKANSMGAQLRRAGEQNLREDVVTTIKEWQIHVKQAALIFLSCPKTMRKHFFDDLQEWLVRDDERIRDVPLDVGRPTFESVCAVHDIMLTLVVREGQEQDGQAVVVETEERNGDNHMNDDGRVPEKAVEIPKQEDIVIPLTPLHVAAQAGDFTTVLQLLDTTLSSSASPSSQGIVEYINQPAGVEFMTPLHYATESASHIDPATAAACVSALLIQGHADPCLVDLRNRPPYFLATHDKVRDAFRIARARLGEDYCRWDEDAKVGPALTAEAMEARKEKEAEKKRRKKAKQKEKKEKDKAHMEELELRRREEEERRQQEEDAKRIRDGLQPRTSTAGNVCDFCQKVCKGKLRHQMFKRLDYAYCSTECVEKHKRELMGAAAMARFNQSATS